MTAGEAQADDAELGDSAGAQRVASAEATAATVAAAAPEGGVSSVGAPSRGDAEVADSDEDLVTRLRDICCSDLTIQKQPRTRSLSVKTG
jgi:hypothetical protein